MLQFNGLAQTSHFFILRWHSLPSSLLLTSSSSILYHSLHTLSRNRSSNFISSQIPGSTRTIRNASFFTSSQKGLSSTMPWNQAISGAEQLVHPTGGSVINPKELIGNDLSVLTDSIKKLLGSGHPVLNTISNYYFNKEGKHVRPILILLIAQATSKADKIPSSKVSSHFIFF